MLAEAVCTSLGCTSKTRSAHAYFIGYLARHSNSGPRCAALCLAASRCGGLPWGAGGAAIAAGEGWPSVGRWDAPGVFAEVALPRRRR
jgi:hypothetical protein